MVHNSKPDGRLLYLSNFFSPPAKPGDYLWIDEECGGGGGEHGDDAGDQYPTGSDPLFERTGGPGPVVFGGLGNPYNRLAEGLAPAGPGPRGNRGLRDSGRLR